MNISVFLMSDGNYHTVGWRHPKAFKDAAFDIGRWVTLAQTMERGKLDMLFVADFPSAIGVDDPVAFAGIARNFGFEPFTLMSALSMATKHLGLTLTANTTWYEPYTIARMLASLDRISGGRAGWNVVTGRNPEDALNYREEGFLEHDRRYERAEEFVDVCFGLWDSFDDDAFVLEQDTGRYLHPERYRLLNHRGPHFAVKGPLNVPRPMQGRPVIVQAGQSGPGMNLAARVAEVVFTNQPLLEEAKAFYRDLKARAVTFGRSPDDIKVLPGIHIYVGETREIARRKLDELQEFVSTEFAIKALSALLGEDMSAYPSEGPVPELKPSKMFNNPEHLARQARAENMNLRQFALHVANTKAHNIVIGTPTEVCDVLEKWFKEEACDGFSLMPGMVPGGLDDFVDLVTPELQRRGLFRREYEGKTLRENLGLARPADARRRLVGQAKEQGALHA